MTAEKLHDAIGLLPADLVAEADARRTPKARVIPWKRYAAMAACLAVILFGGLLFRSKLLPGFDGASKMAACEAAPAAAEDAMVAGMAENYDDGNGNASPSQADSPEIAFGNSTQTSQADTASTREESPVENAENEFDIRYVNTPDNLYSTQCYVSGPGITLVSSRAELDAYCKENQNQYLLEDFTKACETYDEIWFETHDLLLIALDDVAPADVSPTVMEITPVGEGWEVHVQKPLSTVDATTEYTSWHILLEAEKGQISSADAVTLILE